MILNIVSTNIFCPLGKMIGMMQSRTSFILSSQSWEIGNPPTGGAGRMKVSHTSGHTNLTYSYILRKDPPPQCEHCHCILTIHHIFVECNHFAEERKDIFGKGNVVEAFRFHLTLILFHLKECQFYQKFYFIYFDKHFAQLFTLCL